MLNIQASIGMEFKCRKTASRARLIDVANPRHVWLSSDAGRMWRMDLDEFADWWLPVEASEAEKAAKPEPWRPSVDEWDLLPDA